MNLVARIEFGSHLYGTNTPKSDRDYKSVYVPEAKDILLQRVKNSTGHEVVRPEGEKNSPLDTDDEAYSLQRYLGLLAEGQTVAIDMLFAPNPLMETGLWKYIKKHKNRFLTKKSAVFVGYCKNQANKYGIKGSRVAAAKEARDFFQKAYDTLGSTAKVGDLSGNFPIGPHASITAKVTTPGHTETYYDCCNRLVGFKNTVKEALGIYSRIYENYGQRARLAEDNEGIDWKALSHAVRVGDEALELLNTHHITFPLPNREHILEIKQGKLPYAVVAEEIERLLVEVEDAAVKSTLRDEPDYEFIDNIVISEYGRSVVTNGKWNLINGVY